jgi:hypothetical protein
MHRVSQQNKTINRVANQIVATESAIKSLPISQQIATINLADELRSIHPTILRKLVNLNQQLENAFPRRTKKLKMLQIK